jgi:pre-60S factor REI1
LKRKVAELNPVTLDDFNGRMAKHEAQMKTINGEIKEPTGYCVACTKNFGTQKALENHNQSKKHIVST